MRVLYYNWVDYLDPERRGGGVTLYQRNLMAQMAQCDDIEATFLCAGLAQDFRRGAPRWQPMRHGPKQDRDRRFEIVNSAVLAPAHHAFGDPAQIHDAATQACFFDFLAATGPYDVVHFNNLEGLPASVLELKERFPNTRVVLSLHNYYPVCPQVNLWWQERETCVDFDEGRSCIDCLEHQHDASRVRLGQGLAHRLALWGVTPGTRAYEMAFRSVWTAGKVASTSLGKLKTLRTQRRSAAVAAGSGDARAAAARAAAQAFAARRARMVELINTGCDRVLGVSRATSGIAARYGVRPDLLQTLYIGTQVAARAGQAPRVGIERPGPAPDRPVTLGYLGYTRRDKGFFFLLGALEGVADDLAARLHLLIAARGIDAETKARLDALAPRLAGLTLVDGYTHDDLADLTARIDLGAVPVLWNDNLPQVAIEMHVHGLPLLTSDLGGAQEVSNCADLTFRAGDAEALRDRLRGFVEGRVDLRAYWAGTMTPIGMAEHVDALTAVYADG